MLYEKQHLGLTNRLLARYWVFFIGFFYLQCTWTCFAQGISISPSRIFFKGIPGETVQEMITLTNSSSIPFNFTTGLKDWYRDSIGRKVYSDPGTANHSNSQWLKLSESTINLNPNETKRIAVSLTVPQDSSANSLTNSMLFFTQMKEQNKVSKERKQLGVNVLLEVGVQIYHIPSGLTSGELDFLAFEDRGAISIAADSFRRVALKVKNTGKINKDAQVRFELTNMQTGKEIPIKTTAIAMLPEAVQWIYVDLPLSLKGKYLGVAILDAGNNYELRVAEKEIRY
ncbi:COG1470 family protein [Olivibacter domesticus]|uniref:Fn3-like domain-containing protein n=1 Tax=Olivibacter domesticus TaxID=407022 RepID=A0A1H7MD12_OLID1|nr:hypothetical protein [Olivibacter domesticus]SEL09220.1 hypothetical protein SAMN05661044_01962 [Olivibacter domesticus]